MNVIDQEVTDNYAAYHGDCCEVIQSIPDNSIDFGGSYDERFNHQRDYAG